MKTIQQYFRDLFFPFIVLTSFAILFSIIVYVFIDIALGYDVINEPDKAKKLDAIIKILTTSISITGFISVIFAIIYSQKNIQREIQNRTIELFKEFNSNRFKEIRSKAWIIKHKWYNDKNYKNRFLELSYNSTLRKADHEIDREISVVYELLEFYLIVSSCEGNESILRGVRYFYYGWWRPFLYDVGSEIEDRRGICPIVTSIKNDYVDNISYIKNLEKLDKICGLDKIPKDMIIHGDGR